MEIYSVPSRRSAATGSERWELAELSSAVPEHSIVSRYSYDHNRPHTRNPQYQSSSTLLSSTKQHHLPLPQFCTDFKGFLWLAASATKTGPRWDPFYGCFVIWQQDLLQSVSGRTFVTPPALRPTFLYYTASVALYDAIIPF